MHYYLFSHIALSLERLNGAIQASESVEFNKSPYEDNIYHMVLPADWTYYKSMLGEWGFKSLMPSPPGAPSVGHGQVHDGFYNERWKYEGGIRITIP